MNPLLRKNSIQKNLVIIAIFCIFSFQSFSQQKDNLLTKPVKSGYAPVNGLKIYYEVYGEGNPIVLLHGSFMTIQMNWAQIIPELAKTRKVIALEMQGHGHTAYSERPLNYTTLASDVAGVMKYLIIDSADILGYSFGGAVAYQLAIQNPELIKKLIIISAAYKSEGWQPEVRNVLQSMQPAFLDNTPLHTEYIRNAPDTSHWHRFISKMMAFNNTFYNLGDEKIKSIKAPVLLVTGDNDGIDKSILVNTYRLLGGCLFDDMAGIPKSQLAIVPGKSHTSLMMDTGTILSIVQPFLK